MNEQQHQIREQQRESWNEFSGGWKKWDDVTMEFLRPAGDAIIQRLHLSEGSVVLDLAAGTGEPALTIAERIPQGTVHVTDLSDKMLDIARENATARGITNVVFSVCDASEMPFEDAMFDAVSCRFGLMFVPDLQGAVGEIHRVLRPGGRVSTSVWGAPEDNLWVAAIMGSVRRILQLEPPPPDSPGIFRCAENGMVKAMFEHAGFQQVEQRNVGSMFRMDSTEQFWDMLMEVAAPIATAMDSATDEQRRQIKDEVFASMHERFGDGEVTFESNALVISGTR
jgi:ubiquinone/menaquinone biosynthesis C-methylase UbiE